MAQAYGYSPDEVDELPLRDFAVMLRGAIEQQNADWRKVAHLVSTVYNLGGPRDKSFQQKSPSDLYPHLFEESDDDWESQMEEQFNAYDPD